MTTPSLTSFRESYHLRSSSQSEGDALLRSANLAGYVLPAKHGWVPIYAQGPQFTDNLPLIHSAAVPIVHFFELRGSLWTLRLFIDKKLVGEYVAQPGGNVLERSWNLRDDQIEALCPSAEERSLLSQLCGDRPHTTVESVSSFFGLEEEFLNFGQIRAIGRTPARTLLVEPPISPPYCVPNPQLLTTDAFKFPTICFGKHAAVTRSAARWARALRNARERQIDEQLERLERVHFSTLGDQVFFSEGMYCGSQQHAGWRLYSVAEAIATRRSPQRPGSTAAEFASLLRSADGGKGAEAMLRTWNVGLDRFWFVVGVMGCFEAARPWFDRQDRGVRLRIFSHFVRWIPELMSLAPHFVETDEWTLRYPFWARGIVSAAYGCDWTLPVQDLETRFAGDWCRAMLDTGIITRDERQFRVTDRFTGQ